MLSTNIVSIDDELYNYLNDVNYGMSKLQINHLTTIANGLINNLELFRVSCKYKDFKIT